MKNSTVIAAGFLALGLWVLSGEPGAAAGPRHKVQTASSSVDVSAQSRRRPRTRIYIVPSRRQPAAWDYPRPGDVSWPGPGAVRDCVFRLEPEYRPSGTVIVPRQSCWWVRG